MCHGAVTCVLGLALAGQILGCPPQGQLSAGFAQTHPCSSSALALDLRLYQGVRKDFPPLDSGARVTVERGRMWAARLYKKKGDGFDDQNFKVRLDGLTVQSA